jgi:alginate O-acetyltransferase complex protein AlgI
MLFNSPTFLAFFLVVLAVHYSPLEWTPKKGFLLLASYLFYAAWNPPFVALIWLSTVVDWYAAKWMFASSSPTLRRGLLILSLSTNLGLLGFFKYSGFVLENFVGVAQLGGVIFTPVDLGVLLPIGISFYTFQTLSYTIDVYRGQLEPADSPLDFALFVTFFPQLVAGPIVRASEFLPQLVEEKRATSAQMGWGFSLFTLGLFEKVVLADSWMAPTADLVYDAAPLAGAMAAWIGTLAFSAQIFFDFAGYSTCAIGIALCLGFALPDNFRYPYAAIGFSDFWSRWHISLSSWLRDYLYIPLGGNRRGRRRTYINLGLTMLLGGLWHGAAWRFVVWGGLHGAYLGIERWLSKRSLTSGVPKVPAALLTYVLVLITWVFFRAQSFGDGWFILQAMFGMRSDSLFVGNVNTWLVPLVTFGLLFTHWMLRDDSVEGFWSRLPTAMQVLALSAMLIAIVLSPGEDRAFIYFQF